MVLLQACVGSEATATHQFRGRSHTRMVRNGISGTRRHRKQLAVKEEEGCGLMPRRNSASERFEPYQPPTKDPIEVDTDTAATATRILAGTATATATRTRTQEHKNRNNRNNKNNNKAF